MPCTADHWHSGPLIDLSGTFCKKRGPGGDSPGRLNSVSLVGKTLRKQLVVPDTLQTLKLHVEPYLASVLECPVPETVS